MNTIDERVGELLTEIKNKMAEMNLDAENVFLNGNCGNLYTIFANFFTKEAVVPYEIIYEDIPYHIISKIGDNFYDITGKTSLKDYIQCLKERNPGMNFTESNFQIREIGIKDRSFRIRKQSDMYAYNEDYEQSEILNQMGRLYSYLDGFKRKKEVEK